MSQHLRYESELSAHFERAGTLVSLWYIRYRGKAIEHDVSDEMLSTDLAPIAYTLNTIGNTPNISQPRRAIINLSMAIDIYYKIVDHDSIARSLVISSIEAIGT